MKRERRHKQQEIINAENGKQHTTATPQLCVALPKRVCVAD